VPVVTKLGLRPYTADTAPAPRTVPVSVVVLTCDEELNIRRCLASVAWADQVLVIDSGSTDDTVVIAKSYGAEVIEQPWLGFSRQREFSLRLPSIRHNWVYFVDADEWVSPELATEIAELLPQSSYAGFSQRFRLVFQGTWIRHCGWYGGSWIVRLVDRRHAKFHASMVGERVSVDGSIGQLHHDIVDESRKGLAAWLHKHIRYAELEAQRRNETAPLQQRIRDLRSGADSRPMIRGVLKDIVFPLLPAKPAALFVYMYVARLGLLDGITGLRFCFYHAWYEASVAALRADMPRSSERTPDGFEHGSA
jgi:glycosyltransferase involved in cell wall biosynthesis